MFLLNNLPPPIDPALLDRLREAEPATIGHFAMSASWTRGSMPCCQAIAVPPAPR